MYRWVAWTVTVLSAVLLVVGGIGLAVGASIADARDVCGTGPGARYACRTNAVKHADATSMGLRLSQDNGYLTVDVRDNGRGGAGSRPGSGLAGLTDRVAAVAGTLLVDSPAGDGTVIRAVLPCAS